MQLAAAPGELTPWGDSQPTYILKISYEIKLLISHVVKKLDFTRTRKWGRGQPPNLYISTIDCGGEKRELSSWEKKVNTSIPNFIDKIKESARSHSKTLCLWPPKYTGLLYRFQDSLEWSQNPFQQSQNPVQDALRTLSRISGLIPECPQIKNVRRTLSTIRLFSRIFS